LIPVPDAQRPPVPLDVQFAAVDQLLLVPEPIHVTD
jgi:hypothetical protein